MPFNSDFSAHNTTAKWQVAFRGMLQESKGNLVIFCGMTEDAFIRLRVVTVNRQDVTVIARLYSNRLNR